MQDVVRHSEGTPGEDFDEEQLVREESWTGPVSFEIGGIF